MSEEDFKMIIKLLGSINSKLDKLVNLRSKDMAKEIVETLKEEDKENPINSTEAPKKETTEEVLMDLEEVTINVITSRALLVTKKGKQKWVPISTLKDNYILSKQMNQEDQKFDYTVDLKEADFLDKLILNPKGEKWVHTKPWDKLEVRKR